MTLESIMNYNIGNFTAGKFLSALLVLLICLICTKILIKIFSRLIDRLKFEKIHSQNIALCAFRHSHSQ